MTDWNQDQIDDDVFRCDEPEDCDCQFADVDILEGRFHCPSCGLSYYLTAEQLKAELEIHADAARWMEEEAARAYASNNGEAMRTEDGK